MQNKNPKKITLYHDDGTLEEMGWKKYQEKYGRTKK